MADRYVRVRYDDGTEDILPESSLGGMGDLPSLMVPPTPAPAPSPSESEVAFAPLELDFSALEKQKEQGMESRLAQRSPLEQLGLGAYGMLESAGFGVPSAIGRQIAPEQAAALAEQYSQFEEERPFATGAGEFIGGFALPIARSGKAVVQGGLEAVRGAMQPGTLQEKATNALIGGGAGVASGLLGSLLGRGIGTQGQALSEGLAERGLSEAERQLAQRAAKGEVDIAETMAKQPVPAVGGGLSQKDITTAEMLGIPMASLAKAPETASQVREFLETREKVARKRLQSATAATFEFPPGISQVKADRQARLEARRLGKTAQRASNQMAEEVYKELPWQNKLTPEILKKAKQKDVASETMQILDQYGVPYTKTAAKAVNIPKNIEEAFTELEGLRTSNIGKAAFETTFAGRTGGLPNPDKLTLRDYKSISSTLKKWAEGSKEARPTGLQGVRSSELMKVSKAMDAQLKKAVPGLKEADIQFPDIKQAAFGGMSDDARELFSSLGRTKPLRGQQPGEILLKADPGLVREVLAGVEQLGDGEAIDRLRQSVGAYVESISRTKSGRRKLQEILDPAAPQRQILEEFVPEKKLLQLEKTVEQERMMQTSFQRALQNSVTAEVGLEEAAMRAPKPKDLAQKIGKMFRSPVQSVEKALDIAAIEGLDPKVRQELATILLETGPESYERMIKLRPIVERLKNIPAYGDIGAKVGTMVAPKLVGPPLTQQQKQEEFNFEF